MAFQSSQVKLWLFLEAGIIIYFAKIIFCSDKYTTVLSFDKTTSHHICLSAVSCDFLHQEILAFRCIGRLLGGRLVKRHWHVGVLVDEGGDFSPSLSLKESGDLTGENYNSVPTEF